MALRGSISNALTAAATTISLSMTSGWTGSAPQVGDIILLSVAANIGSLPTWSISGSTFTQVTGTAGMTGIPASQGNNSASVFFRVCNGTETSLTIGIGSSHLYSVTARAYSGRSATPFAVTPVTEGPGGEVTTPCTLSTIGTGITGNATDDLVLFCIIGQLNSGTDVVTFTPPTNFGNSVLNEGTSTVNSPPIGSCDYANYPGGAVTLTGGSFSWTGGGEKGWGGYLISLAAGGSSCTDAGYSSGGAIATPNGTSGSYVGNMGAFVTPNCSSIHYWNPASGSFKTSGLLAPLAWIIARRNERRGPT